MTTSERASVILKLLSEAVNLPQTLARDLISSSIDIAIADATQKILAQLPKGMENCTILFKACPLGHGWLTAKHWVQHDCPTCKRNFLEAENELLQRIEKNNLAMLDEAAQLIETAIETTEQVVGDFPGWTEDDSLMSRARRFLGQMEQP